MNENKITYDTEIMEGTDGGTPLDNYNPDTTYYYSYYILIDDAQNIITGWSNGPQPDRDTTGAVLLTDKGGGYQFRLFPGGEENPVLTDFNGVYLYRYINGEVVAKTPEEIAAETPQPYAPTPAELREHAYETLPVVPWPDAETLITVDEAVKICTSYYFEGDSKADKVAALQGLIHDAKEQIREQYPDV